MPTPRIQVVPLRRALAPLKPIRVIRIIRVICCSLTQMPDTAQGTLPPLKTLSPEQLPQKTDVVRHFAPLGSRPERCRHLRRRLVTISGIAAHSLREHAL